MLDCAGEERGGGKGIGWPSECSLCRGRSQRSPCQPHLRVRRLHTALTLAYTGLMWKNSPFVQIGDEDVLAPDTEVHARFPDRLKLLQMGGSPEAVGRDLEGGAQSSSVCVAVRVHSSRAGLQRGCLPERGCRNTCRGLHSGQQTHA